MSFLVELIALILANRMFCVYFKPFFRSDSESELSYFLLYQPALAPDDTLKFFVENPGNLNLAVRLLIFTPFSLSFSTSSLPDQ